MSRLTAWVSMQTTDFFLFHEASFKNKPLAPAVWEMSVKLYSKRMFGTNHVWRRTVHLTPAGDEKSKAVRTKPHYFVEQEQIKWVFRFKDTPDFMWNCFLTNHLMFNPNFINSLVAWCQRN